MAQVAVDPTQDTELAHGIIPPKPPSREDSPELPSEREQKDAARKQATVEDFDEELEDADDEEERILQRLRQERLKEIASAYTQARFGRVYPIARPDYTREVTEASKENPPGAPPNTGTGVVCFLYKPGVDTSQLVSGYLDMLAAKHPGTKFVSIVGNQCIPNYPDRNLPTLLIYRRGEIRRQIVGLRPEIGLDGMNTKLAELLLVAVGAIDPPKPGTVPRPESKESEKPTSIRQSNIGDDDDLDWD